MKYINLIDKLTDTDKKKIEAYIYKNGCQKDEFIGLDKWLASWSHANQKLYKLLGEEFIHSFPFIYTKSDREYENELRELIRYSDFKDNYHDFYLDYIRNEKGEFYGNEEVRRFFNCLMNIENFKNEAIETGIKLKKAGANKMLQIQAGTKPLRALSRVIDYFKDDFEFDVEAFEEFKKKYAIIRSEKELKGKAFISIHPLDYMTMSDNASNWSSCMSWRDDGCYHVGTVEMMNSNNVLCCYFILDNSSIPFVFDHNAEDPDTGELYGIWNNKKWRQLFYITKDIIQSGKPYPYVNKDVTFKILDEIKNLAEKNLGWTYEYGIEQYMDMEHVGSMSRMENQKMWARTEKSKPAKHNIIWDTKGMYNDMLNDRDMEYWCYRNKTNHTKVICVSGKAPCLCCGESVVTENEDCCDEYNDRYENTHSVICRECLDTKFTCTYCDCTSPRRKLYTLANGDKICSNCAEKLYKDKETGIIYKPEYSINNIYYNSKIYEALQNGTLPKQEDDVEIYFNYFDALYRDREMDMDEENSPQWIIGENRYNEKEYRLNVEVLYCPNPIRSKVDEIKQYCLPFKYTVKSFWSSTREETIWFIDPKYADLYRSTKMQKATLEDLNNQMERENVA